MQSIYRIVFRGRLSADLPAPEVRQRLLKLYGGKTEVADRFFTGRPLIVRKDLDYQAAQKYKAMFERAGVPCDVVEDRPPVPVTPLQKETVPQVENKAAPKVDTVGPKEPVQRLRPATAAPAAKTNMPRQGDIPPGMSATSSVSQAVPKPAGPLLKGSKTQNILAVVMILLIMVSAGVRIWAINAGRGIHPPDHVSCKRKRGQPAFKRHDLFSYVRRPHLCSAFRSRPSA